MPSYGMYPDAMKKATANVAGKKKDERESASMKQREYDMGEQMEAQMEKKKKKLKVRKTKFNPFEND